MSNIIEKVALMKSKVKSELITFLTNEEAIGTVELILILVVLIGLVIIFRDQLTTLVNSIFERIASDSAAV